MDPEKITIKLFYDRGVQPCDIAEALARLQITKSKIYRVCKRLSKGDSVDNRHRSGRSRTARTAAAIKNVREQIRKNPQRSTNSLASHHRMSRWSVRRILREDLGLYPCKKHPVHGLTNASISKRFDRCRMLKSRHAGKNLESIVFSDEKLFSVEERMNSQNVRVYSVSFEDIPEEIRTVQRFQKENKVCSLE